VTAEIARQARDLMRESATAALATELQAEDGGWPYASYVTVACDLDAAPILLLSDLAEHTKNLKRDPKVSLLFTAPVATDAKGDPLARGRVTVLGTAVPSDEPRHRARFLARHPEAEGYAGFRDFRFYKVEAVRAHLVAGFGRIHWAEPVLYQGGWAPLAEAEAEILAHMNADHADAVQLYGKQLIAIPEQDQPWRPWIMTGIDPEGCDLAAGPRIGRVSFQAPVLDAEGARAELVRLAKQARAG
jgi:putative heme iron utilization protein